MFVAAIGHAATAARPPQEEFGAFVKSQRRRAVFFALLLGFVASGTLEGQAVSPARLSGSLLGSNVTPVRGALISVEAVGGGASYRATSNFDGSFSVPVIQPGAYTIRVESVGYRPLLVQGLVLNGGEDRSLSLTLTINPPPVELVDTITVAGATSSRWRAGGLQLGVTDIDLPAYRFEDLADIVASATAFDGSLGAQGLPGEQTLILADGVPFYRATHPTLRAEETPNILFNRSLIDAVAIASNATDASVPGAAGGYVSLTTRTASTSEAGIGGSYSGDPLWSSTEHDFTTPALLNWQGYASTNAEVGPGSSLLVAGDALQHESPTAVRVADGGALGGLAQEEIDLLTTPGVETVRRYSGLVRFDHQISGTDRFFVRGITGVSERMYAGRGPLAAAATPDESVDFSAVLGYAGQSSSGVVVDVRGGISRSSRDFSNSGPAGAFLSSPFASLGSATSVTGSSSRTDVLLLPSLQIETSVGQIRTGLSFRNTAHSMEQASQSFAFGSGPDLVSGNGFTRTRALPAADFSTRDFGVYAQLDRVVSPQLTLSIGGRYDSERLGNEGSVPLNNAWSAASGLSNDSTKSTHHQFGARGTLSWSPSPTGRTRVFFVAALDHGEIDPRGVYRIHAEAVDATDARVLGSGLSWTDGGLPTGAPERTSITMFGPDIRAPRTFGTEIALVQPMGNGTVLSARGAMRRTDFLLRSRNLNTPVIPLGQDPGGRPLLGTLTVDGPFVGAFGDDGRRFTDFGTVTALDPDGWSEYRGATVSLEHAAATGSFFGSYTWSETTDNWVGAASGLPDAGLPSGVPDENWSEALSDFDRTHRASAGATTAVGPATVSVLYRFRSGTPYTPGYRFGVDANGDGSAANDVALTMDAAATSALAGVSTCSTAAGDFAARNSCRMPSHHQLNARIDFAVAQVGTRTARLTIDLLNAIESKGGIVDSALLLVDPTGTITTAGDGTVTIPTMVNPNFGEVVYPTSRGRILRVGFRFGS